MKTRNNLHFKQLCLFFVGIVFIFTIIISYSAVAYTDANAKITIIKQYQDKYKDLTVPGTSYTLYKGGCGLFSIAHAIQWLSNTKVSGDAEFNLLKKLVDLKMNTIGNMTDSLDKLVKSDKTLIYHKGALPKSTISNNSSTQNEALFKSIFDSNGVVITNPTGHYVLAVGYKYYSDKMYIQIIDSAGASTIEPRGDGLNLHIGYKYDSMEKITSGNGGGVQYWIPSECFFGKCSHDRKFRDWWWLSGYSSYVLGTAPKPSSIELNMSTASLNLSDTLALSVIAYPAGSNSSVNWTSSDTTVATVTNGVVTPIKAGHTITITATSTVDASVTASCQVTTYYQGSDTLKFNGVKYPHTYNKNKSISWAGIVESDVALSSVTVNLYQNEIMYTQNASISAGSKTFSMSNLGNTVFQNLSTGKFTFEIIAADSVGRRIAYSNSTCTANTSGDHVLYDVPGSYSRPRLLGSGERNGHRYEVYENTGRDWDADRDYAIELGGHLATVSDADENEFICNLVVSSGGTYGFVGGYYDSGWHWVDGTPFNYSVWNSSSPADGSFGYPAVVGLASANSKTWAKSLKSNMMNFVVEYDPVMISSIVLEGSNTMTVDDTQSITATVLPENAYNKDFVFSSSNTAIATVDSITGVVTAVGEGEAKIFAAAQDGSGVIGEIQLFIQHKPIPVISIELQADSSLYTGTKQMQMTVGDIAYLEAIVTPTNADNQKAFFSSSDEEVASFELGDGELVANKEGNCRIWCYTVDNQFSDYLDLVVLPVSGQCGDNATWFYSNGTLTISGTGAMTDYSAPEETPWNGFAGKITSIIVDSGVTRIGGQSFKYLGNLTSVSLPQSLQTIGESAFYGSGVSDIWIPRGVTDIENNAFTFCNNLTSINIPSTVTTIGTDVFYGSTNLASINVAVANEKYHSEDGVLFDEWSLFCFPAGKVCDEYTIPDTAKWISRTAFSFSKVKSVRVPESVGLIFNYSFSYTTNLSVTIPKSVTYIGDGIFAESNNVTVYCFEDSTALTYCTDNNIHYVLIDTPLNNPDFIVPPAVTIIDEEAFTGIAAKRVKLPEGITAIRALAFADCPNLVAVYIPEDCTSIATNAFSGCTNLTIYGHEGSYAEFYAGKQGFVFKAVD